MWDVVTWLLGLPTSSSHALIGGYAGAAMARATILHGWRSAPSVIIPSGWTKTLLFIVVAPLMGLVLGFGFMVAISWIFRRKSPRQVDGSSANCNWFQRRFTAWDTVATMRRRPWALSPARSIPPA